MKYVLYTVIAAVMLPVMILALLSLYYAPAGIRNPICLVLAATGLIGAVVMLIREGRR